MKSKLIIGIALIALVAAACNKTASDSTPAANQTQQSANTSSNTAANATSSNTAGRVQNGTTTRNNPNGADYFPTPTPPVKGSEGGDVAPAPSVLEVDMTANGFSPSSITINKGDYIQFVNKDTVAHWPASNPHPLHNGYPSNPHFDAAAPVQPGKYYRFQFNISGTYGYHDHLNPSTKGTVVIK